MNYTKQIVGLFLCAFFVQFSVFAHVNPEDVKERKKKKEAAQYRFDCSESRTERDLDVNNVRARLQTGGDLFWDFNNGRYIVPKRDPESGIEEVSSIFAAGVWLGGVLPNEDGGSITYKIACQDYRTSNGVDFYPGPLTDAEGTTEQETCRNWDRFFRVKGDSIRKHIENFEFYNSQGATYPASAIPADVRNWPGIGNQFWSEDFELPDAQQGLGNFRDLNGNNIYEPDLGEYPVISIAGCPDEQYPDDMYFFIYNDAGNTHNVTGGDPIRMEVQVQAFGYQTQDEVNDMTFYRYKLINRAAEAIDSTFFAMWIDPDLGCPEDDYIGCDSTQSLMYVYNQDAVDGENGCDCNVGGLIPTYCNDVPILGVDYFRGPLSEPRFNPDSNKFIREDLGMSSFSYYARGGQGFPPGMEDPQRGNLQEWYNLLNGSWRDGTPLTFGGNGYGSGGQTTRYAFPFGPNSQDWNMCAEGLQSADLRTLQATGPFRLDPGAINELIIGVIWLAEAEYPCPSIEPLLRADLTAQSLFNDCFEILDGPTAPTMCPLELDQEVIFTLVNQPGSNNFGLGYEQKDPRLAEGAMVEDSTYKFEGYRIYQLASADIKAIEENFSDISKAREVLSYDLKNGITTIYNWESVANPNSSEEEFIWFPVEKVVGRDNGIQHSFSIKNDAFASGEDTRLINFQKYYYTVVAYAHNEHTPFDVNDPIIGQRTPYILGRLNVKEYAVTPRKTNHINVNALYGEGLEVTRLDGNGVQNNTLIISKEERERIAQSVSVEEVHYVPGGDPLNAKIYDPVFVKDGEYLLSFDNYEDDPTMQNTRFVVEQVEGDMVGDTVVSESSISKLNEELINKFGFSVYFGQGGVPGRPYEDENNGLLGTAIEYDDDLGPQWYNFIPEAASPAVNFIKTDITTAEDNLVLDVDPNEIYSKEANNGFYPFQLLAYDTNYLSSSLQQTNNILYSPGWMNSGASKFVLNAREDGLNVNNVDIVLTSNKELWSRSIAVQSANYVFTSQIDSFADNMDILLYPSVTKEASASNDNVPAVDQSAQGDDAVGYTYFPGYAVDVETGKRLNIFFGENTFFRPGAIPNFPDSVMTGNDRMWNPNQFIPQFDFLLAGGLHYIYVTDTEYDGCKVLHDELQAVANAQSFRKRIVKTQQFQSITWAGFPIMAADQKLLSYKDGLIPNELTLSLRAISPFSREAHSNTNDGFNQYRIKIEGKQSTTLNTEEVDNALDLINVVPNPYYAYSVYENTATDNIVKITNLPRECTISIYSLDGRFIRKYERNESDGIKPFDNAPIPTTLFATDVEWNLQNDNGIPISSGIYFIHIEAPGMGERVIKWFGVNRKFDPSGL